MGAIIIQKKTYEICPLLPVAREQEVVPEEPEEEREQRERTVQVQQVTPELMKSVLFLLASPMLSGGAVEKHDYDEEKKSLTVMFQRREGY